MTPAARRPHARPALLAGHRDTAAAHNTHCVTGTNTHRTRAHDTDCVRVNGTHCVSVRDARHAPTPPTSRATTWPRRSHANTIRVPRATDTAAASGTDTSCGSGTRTRPTAEPTAHPADSAYPGDQQSSGRACASDTRAARADLTAALTHCGVDVHTALDRAIGHAVTGIALTGRPDIDRATGHDAHPALTPDATRPDSTRPAHARDSIAVPASGTRSRPAVDRPQRGTPERSDLTPTPEASDLSPPTAPAAARPEHAPTGTPRPTPAATVRVTADSTHPAPSRRPTEQDRT